MVVLLKDDEMKFFCTFCSTTHGLFESIARYILDVLKYASISFMLSERQDTKLAYDLVHLPEIECYPAQVEIPRDIAEIRLTSRGGRYGDKHDV